MNDFGSDSNVTCLYLPSIGGGGYLEAYISTAPERRNWLKKKFSLDGSDVLVLCRNPIVHSRVSLLPGVLLANLGIRLKQAADAGFKAFPYSVGGQCFIVYY